MNTITFNAFLSLLMLINVVYSIEHDHLLCRKCGNEQTENIIENFVNVTSPHSESIHKISIFGHSHLVVQSLRNPADVVFYLVTVKLAGCAGVGEWHSQHTWFPGFSWKVCICPRCKGHLGWVFEPTKNIQGELPTRASKEGFYGLIVDSLISEDFSDSLVITLPKTLGI